MKSDLVYMDEDAMVCRANELFVKIAFSLYTRYTIYMS